MTPERVAVERELRRTLARYDLAPVVRFPQLCAVARDVSQSGICQTEWTARVKDRLGRLGFQAPTTEFVSRAMRAVERPPARRPA